MDTLTTQRLTLRPFKESDLVELYNYARDPAVGPPAGWRPHESMEETRAILQSFIKLDEVWAIVLQATGKLIGSVGLHPDRKRTRPGTRMLGYVLASHSWGHGYMTEAAAAAMHYGFTGLGLDLVTVYHYPANGRSRRVIEKCGFCYEGRLRNASVLPNGDMTDELCYSLTREEYTKLYAEHKTAAGH